MSEKYPLIQVFAFHGEELSSLRMDTEDFLALKFHDAMKRLYHCGKFPEIKPGYLYEFRFEFTERLSPFAGKDRK